MLGASPLSFALPYQKFTLLLMGNLLDYLHSGLLVSQGPACLWLGDTVAIGTEVAGQGWFKHPAVCSPPRRH